MNNQVWFARPVNDNSLPDTTTVLLFSSGKSGITVQMAVYHSEKIQNCGTAHTQVKFQLKISYS